MPRFISILHNLEENGLKCAVKANNFLDPGTVLKLVPGNLYLVYRVQRVEFRGQTQASDGVRLSLRYALR